MKTATKKDEILFWVWFIYLIIPLICILNLSNSTEALSGLIMWFWGMFLLLFTLKIKVN